MRKQSDVIHRTILVVARELFIANGYDATTIDQIAKASGVTKRTVYSHYQDKSTIFKSAIQDLISSNLEPDLNDNLKVESKDDLYKTLHIIAKTLNDTFAQDSYVQLLRIAISEINTHAEFKNIHSISIVGCSMKKLQHIFELTNTSGLTSMKSVDNGARMFIGGFLVKFYIDGLLGQNTSEYEKFTSEEIYNYIDKFMHILFDPK